MFRHGFKSWCERIALERRTELGLKPDDRLDPRLLAEHLGITVLQPSAIPGLSQKSLTQLLETDRDGWSAITLRQDTRSLIVLNTAHSAARQVSDLMHELAHILLAHTPSRVDVTVDMYLLLRTHDHAQEDEANWFAGCLLLPRPAVLDIHRRKEPAPDAAKRYGVSVEMMNYRLQVTGVAIQERRLKARLGR